MRLNQVIAMPLILLATSLSGCGTKGPLKLPPKPQAIPAVPPAPAMPPGNPNTATELN